MHFWVHKFLIYNIQLCITIIRRLKSTNISATAPVIFDFRRCGTYKMLELLPEDVLIIILRKLDFKSQSNLCEALKSIRKIFMEYKITKECDLSLSTSATVKTLQTQFFKIIAPYLWKLNLSAVSDLSKTSLMPIMAKLKHLKTLDVSYTRINLKDFIDIYRVCPTINNLTIPIDIHPNCSTKVLRGIYSECQKIFKHFECIHFLGSYCNLICRSIQLMLKLSNLKILQYTVLNGTRYSFLIEDHFEDIMLSCKHFYIIFKSPHCSSLNTVSISFPFNAVHVESYEYLIIQSDLKHWDVYGSPVFNNFFKEKFDATVKNNFPVRDNGHIMLWMKDAHTFDEVFFKQLHKTIRQFLVYFTLDTWNSNCIPNYDRFCITPRDNDSSSTQSSVEVGFKRKRIVKENYVLDYDKYFQEKNEVELSLMFSLYVLKTAITFNSECEYLKKLTYLSLVGAEKYTATFFNTLFRSCIKLVTLNVAIGNLNANDVVRSAPLSHTIKNLRIVAKMIDFNSVLTSLSQCPSLENVHIVDLSITSSSMIFDPTTIVQKCVNLYCVHIIYAFELSKNKQAKQLKIIEDIKTKFHKPYLSFKLFNSTGVYHESKPFIDVFKID